MNIPGRNLSEIKSPLGNPILWAIFILYILVSGYTISHHELWGDEVHSWNISKGSGSYFDLIANRRYEGHPPGWYTILWTISKFTHNVAYMQAAQWVLACSVVFMVLFFSPFPIATRMLIPFGYYFLFEYAVISRNYSLAVLFACLICFIIRRDFKYKFLLYYFLLFCMSNVHLLALLLAASFHLYFLLLNIEKKEKTTTIGLHILLGVIIFLPATYFIFPPSDSALNVNFWMKIWSSHQLITLGQAPLRAFIPMPAWWYYNFWNTEFLLEAKTNYSIFNFINPLVVLTLLVSVFFILRKNKKSLALFGANLLLSFILAVAVFALTTARYAGFIYIGFIMAYWLFCYETPVTRINKWMVNILLITQLIAGVFAISKDIQLPFANLYKIDELLKEIPANDKLVTDYWTANAFIAFTDKPAYCIDMKKEISFLLWASDLEVIQKDPYRYCTGLKYFFQKEGVKTTYLISMAPSQSLFKVDPLLSTSFHVTLIDKREGAIEKGSNLYLYQITEQ